MHRDELSGKELRTRALWLAAVSMALVFSAPGTAAAQRHNTVSFEEGEEGWYPIFDGRSLDGLVIGGQADWQVRDGEIVVESGGQSLLVTEETFTDFELKVDFLAAPETNSGVFLRVTTTDPAAGGKMYELNIAPASTPFPTGSLMRVEAPPGGGAPKFGVAQKVDAGASEEWRTFYVVARGGRITVHLDGEKLVELEDPDPVLEGHLGLQHNQGRVAFRNWKVRRLAL